MAETNDTEGNRPREVHYHSLLPRGFVDGDGALLGCFAVLAVCVTVVLVVYRIYPAVTP